VPRSVRAAAASAEGSGSGGGERSAWSARSAKAAGSMRRSFQRWADRCATVATEIVRFAGIGAFGGWDGAEKPGRREGACGRLGAYGRVGAFACARSGERTPLTGMAAFGRRDDRVAAALRFAWRALGEKCNVCRT
jgi:hypothetical protein